MSAVVKLSTKLPGDFETNGLDAHVEDLVENPETLRLAVVWFDTQKVVVDTDSGNHIPTVRVRRFEPLGEADDVSAAIRDAVQAAVQKRTGRTPIPFDVAEVLEGHDPDQLSIEDDE